MRGQLNSASVTVEDPGDMKIEGLIGREDSWEILNHLKQHGFKWQQKHINLDFQQNSMAQVHSQDPLQKWAQAADWSKKPNHCLFVKARILLPG